MEKRLATGLLLFHLLLLLVAALGGANGSSKLLASSRGDLVEIDGVTYYVDATSQVDYFNATAQCEELDMTLVRFENLDKNDLIVSTLNDTAEYSDKYMWTAGRHGEHVFWGQWYWGFNKTFGPRLTEFDWGPEMPFWPLLNYTSCISIRPKDGFWEDHLCEYVMMGFVCQPVD